MNKKIFVCVSGLLFLFSIFSVTVKSQPPVDGLGFDISAVKNFPSPTAATFAKVEDIPVDLYNGTSSLTIPLHVFGTGKISVPITLRYQSTGLKVQERAGWVGLGWNLQAGGVITRVTKGIPDDYDDQGYIYTAAGLKHSYPQPSTSEGRKTLNEISERTYDSEPDEFYISTPTVSGKMVFMDGEFRLIFKQKVKITKTTSNYKIISWTVTDESGIVYTFEKTETTSSDTNSSYNGNESTGSGSYTSATSAWYLTKIDHPQSDTDVLLEYTTELYSSSQFTETHGRTVYDHTGVDPFCISVPDGTLESTTDMFNTVTYLSRIKLSDNANTFVQFTNTARTDLSNERKLSTITVYEDSVFVKEYRLGYGYFSDGGTHTRLRLDSVQQYNTSGTATLPPYAFTYSGLSIPKYDSRAVDYWGYYNGVTSNTHYVPTTYYLGTLIFTGANRDPSSGIHGMLTKVTYPTGGSASFTYEGNDYSFVGSSAKSGQIAGGGMRIKQVKLHDGVSSTNDVIKNYTYDMEDGSGRSSGVIYGEPTYVKTGTTNVFDPSISVTHACTYKEILPSAFFQIGHYSGGHLGYKRVTEITSSANDFGKVVHHFEKTPSHNFGNLIKKEVLNSTGGTVTEHSSDYEYKTQHQASTYFNWAQGMEVERKIESIRVSGGFEDDTSFVQRFYSLYDQWKYLKSDTVKVFNGGTNATEVITDYTYADSTYGQNRFMQLISKKETNSNGDTRVTKYKYAHEEFAAMADSNMFFQPYSVTVEDATGKVQSKNWTVWSNQTVGNANWNVRSQWQWIGDGTTGDTTAPADTTGSEVLKTAEVTRYDAYGNILETKDAADVKTAYEWSAGGTTPIGIFRNAAKNQAFAHSFAYDGLTGWTIYNADGQDFDVSIDQGKLKLTNYASASNEELDRVHYDYGSEITGTVVVEFDVQMANSNNWDLIIAVGGNTWNYGNGGTETAVWSAINNESWRYYAGSWGTITSGLEIGKTYAFKMVLNTTLNRVDFYVDGKKWISNASFRQSSTGIQKIVFGSYGYGTTTTNWYIDNVRMYPEGALAQSQEADPVLGTPLAIKDASGSTSRFDYDSFGRLTNSYNPNGERVSRNVYYYSLDGNSSYTTTDPNRVETITYNDPADTTDKTLSLTYLDGLGRAIQSQVRAADGTAVVTGALYDKRGLPHLNSRPVELNVNSYTNGYVNDLWGTGFTAGLGASLPTNSQVYQYYDSGFSGTTDALYAYTQSQFEDSPLARPVAEGKAAAALRIGQNETLMSYGLNSGANENLGTGFGLQELTKTTATDPNGNKSFTFSDGWGNTIATVVDYNNNGLAKRGTLSSDDLVTEFQYDLRNQIKQVKDPKGFTTDYTYNQRGQLVAKDLPDKDASDEYRYDVRGNLRFVQSAKHKNNGSQSTLYNNNLYSDQTLTIAGDGVIDFDIDFSISSPEDEVDFDLEYEDGSDIHSYYFTAWETATSGIHPVGKGSYKLNQQVIFADGQYGLWTTVIYKPFKFTYNNYDELGRVTETGEYYGTTSFANMNTENDVTASTIPMQKYFYGEANAKAGANNTKGRLTKVQYRDVHITSNSWGTTWYSYNTQGLIEWIIQDLPGSAMGEKKIEYVYDELGRTTEMKFQAGSASEDRYFRYSYDKLGRLAKVESRHDPAGSWIEDAGYTYFADGQLQELNLGGNDQSVDYSYNSAGWLRFINNPDNFIESSSGFASDRFGLELRYYNSVGSGDTGYNGNIGRVRWEQYLKGTSTDEPEYQFKYDRANRLTDALYNNSAGTDDNNNGMDVDYTYDKNGNMDLFLRYGTGGNTDYYDIFHETGKNRIDYIQDAALYENFYVDYDPNGNMIKNELNGLQKGWYDSRNLPNYLRANSSTVYYVYDADGQRIKKQVAGGTQTHYVRGAGGETIAIYENGSIKHWNLVTGADIIGTWDGTQRRYFLKDHLGSIRTTVDQSGNADGYDDYYPFGLVMPGRSSNSANPTDNYKFTGHERDNEAGIDLTYAGARYLDPVIGRWLSIDPLAAKYPNLNPYNYVMNNPVNAFDPDGRDVWFVHGTFSNKDTWTRDGIDYDTRWASALNDNNYHRFDWNFGYGNSWLNTVGSRTRAAKRLADDIELAYMANPEMLVQLVAHSHGGNVAIEAANILRRRGIEVDRLVLLGTPSRDRYTLDEGAVKEGGLYNFSDYNDMVQRAGGTDFLFGLFGDKDTGLAGRNRSGEEGAIEIRAISNRGAKKSHTMIHTTQELIDWIYEQLRDKEKQ